jgi:hypothetical protein
VACLTLAERPSAKPRSGGTFGVAAVGAVIALALVQRSPARRPDPARTPEPVEPVGAQ